MTHKYTLHIENALYSGPQAYWEEANLLAFMLVPWPDIYVLNYLSVYDDIFIICSIVILHISTFSYLNSFLVQKQTSKKPETKISVTVWVQRTNHLCLNNKENGSF